MFLMKYVCMNYVYMNDARLIWTNKHARKRVARTHTALQLGHTPHCIHSVMSAQLSVSSLGMKSCLSSPPSVTLHDFSTCVWFPESTTCKQLCSLMFTLVGFLRTDLKSG